MYQPDNANRSSVPTYHDANWPYVQLVSGPITAPATLVPLLSVTAGSLVVRINGLPIYLFVGDTTTGTCSCDGVDGFFTVRPSPPLPPSLDSAQPSSSSQSAKLLGLTSSSSADQRHWSQLRPAGRGQAHEHGWQRA